MIQRVIRHGTNTLVVSGNVPSDISDNVTNLEICDVDELDLSVLKDKSHLRSIRIYDCGRIHNIDSIPMEVTTLQIKNSRFDRSLDVLKNLTNIDHLSVISCGIDTVSDDYIENNRQLIGLSLKNNYIDDDTVLNRLLNGLPNLINLSLEGNYLSGCIDETTILSHSSIQKIYLQNTYMTRPKDNSPKVTYIHLDYRSRERGRVPFYSSDDNVKVYLLNDRGDSIRNVGHALQHLSNANGAEYHNGILQLVSALRRMI